MSLVLMKKYRVAIAIGLITLAVLAGVVGYLYHIRAQRSQDQHRIDALELALKKALSDAQVCNKALQDAKAHHADAAEIKRLEAELAKKVQDAATTKKTLKDSSGEMKKVIVGDGEQAAEDGKKDSDSAASDTLLSDEHDGSMSNFFADEDQQQDLGQVLDDIASMTPSSSSHGDAAWTSPRGIVESSSNKKAGPAHNADKKNEHGSEPVGYERPAFHDDAEADFRVGDDLDRRLDRDDDAYDRAELEAEIEHINRRMQNEVNREVKTQILKMI